MADPIFDCLWRGERVTLTMADLTVQRLREVKSELGDRYGSSAQIMGMLQLGDMDAYAVMFWIHLQKTRKPEPLLSIDFSMDDIEVVPEDEQVKRPARKGSGKPQSEDTSESTSSDET